MFEDTGSARFTGMFKLKIDNNFELNKAERLSKSFNNVAATTTNTMHARTVKNSLHARKHSTKHKVIHFMFASLCYSKPLVVTS